MATRDSLFDQFGPLLMEAMFEELLKELNSIRTLIGQPTISVQSITDSIDTKVPLLEEYDWMKEIDEKVKSLELEKK